MRDKRKTHADDRGGWPSNERIDPTEHPMLAWEAETFILNVLLIKKGIFRAGQSRLPIERMTRKEYESLGYFERLASSLETRLIEKGLTTKREIAGKVTKMTNSRRVQSA